MAAVIGALRADLSASVGKFQDDMGRAGKAVEQFTKRAERQAQALQNAGQRMTLAITAPFIALGVTSAKAAAESRDALAAVESRLQSMGGASGKTAEQLEEAAAKLQRLSTYDDDDILRNVTNAFLTFGNVAGDVFDRGQRVVVDMSTALKTDLQSSALQVGKALNNPIKGITALTRVGVSFTEQQKDQIKSLTDAGRIYEAQGIILAELEREFMGAGKAARDAVPGSDAIDSWREFQEVIGEVFLRAIEAVEPFVVTVLDAFNNLTPGMQTFIVAAGGVAAAMGPLIWAAGSFMGAVAELAPIWGSFVKIFTDAMLATGITNVGVALRALGVYLGPIVGAVGLVVTALWEFRGVFEEVFGYLVAHFQQSVLPALQNLWSALQEAFAAFGEIMDGPLGEFVDFVMWAVAEVSALLLQGLGHAVISVVGTFVDLLATAVRAVADLVKVVAALLRGDWAGAWEAAGDLVGNVLDGILGAFENVIPGITGAVTAVVDAIREGWQNRLGEILNWIEGRFPGLVSAVQAAAQGAVAWAKNLYDGIKTWIGDNLGPLLQWAQERIRELNSLFGWIQRRQAQVRGGGSSTPAEAPAPAPARPAASRAPVSTGGGGGGGGGRSGKSDAEKAADKLRKDTDKFREALEGVQDGIDQAFDRRNLPRSIQQANDLRQRLADLADEARESGVDVGAFAEQMDTLKARISELEIEGLALEAQAFARDVRDLSDEVQGFAGDLPALDVQLRTIDRDYEDLRQEILDQIRENAALAEANDSAAEAMVRLQAQLARLDAAHRKAKESAQALHDAEQALADLQAAADRAGVQQQITDLSRRRGEDQTFSRGMQEVRQIEQELADMRIKSAIELASLNREIIEAEANGDAAQVVRLQQQLALQQQLHELVTSTTAQQIQAAERMQRAFEDFVDGLSDELADMVMDWEFDLDGLRSVFKDLARQLFIQPVTDSFSAGIGNFLKSFAGGFAGGGSFGPNQWAITSEDGPELVYSGAKRMNVVSNDEAFGRRGGGNTYINVTTPNADSFRASQRQIARRAKQTLGADS